MDHPITCTFTAKERGKRNKLISLAHKISTYNNTNFQFRQDKPLIVLEAGGGTGAVSFMPLMDGLSSEFRMCAYDRAGYP